jgi:hypothetical protein
MSVASDRVRSVTVAVFAVAQVLSAPVTSLALGPSSDQGPISDANLSPVTPAGYAFAVWGLIYLASLALAIYQLLPDQRARPVHRSTGWWLAGAFAASTVWVPIFGTRTIWLSQLVIIMLVVCLAFATHRFTRLGPAATAAERYLFRMPITIYLGWATMACFAGFGTTFRSFGMPAEARWVNEISFVLVLSATIMSLFVVGRLAAVLGFVLTGCWALVAVAVATYVDSVRLAAVLAITVVVAVVIGRTLRSPDRDFVLFG